jgi:hypothetical protein
MSPTPVRPLLVGIFEEHRRAQDALRLLVEVGLGRHQLGFVVRRGEVLQADGALMGVAAPEHDLAGGLIGLGVPRAQARTVASEFERGHTVVTVQPEWHLQIAERALELAGAHSVLAWSSRTAQ